MCTIVYQNCGPQFWAKRLRLGPDLRRLNQNDKISPIGMVYLMYHLLGTVKLIGENETPY